jgi:type IV secretory pathway VirB2 component (pilin)
MSVRLDPRTLADAREIPLTARPRACTDRTFNIPVSLHAAYFGLCFAFLGVMWAGFASPGLALPMVVCVFFTAAFYAVPMLWATMGPPNPGRSMPLAALMDKGVDTLTGPCSGGAAIAQVLVLPALLLLWGLAVVTIAALV